MLLALGNLLDVLADMHGRASALVRSFACYITSLIRLMAANPEVGVEALLAYHVRFVDRHASSPEVCATHMANWGLSDSQCYTADFGGLASGPASAGGGGAGGAAAAAVGWPRGVTCSLFQGSGVCTYNPCRYLHTCEHVTAGAVCGGAHRTLDHQ